MATINCPRCRNTIAIDDLKMISHIGDIRITCGSCHHAFTLGGGVGDKTKSRKHSAPMEPWKEVLYIPRWAIVFLGVLNSLISFIVILRVYDLHYPVNPNFRYPIGIFVAILVFLFHRIGIVQMSDSKRDFDHIVLVTMFSTISLLPLVVFIAYSPNDWAEFSIVMGLVVWAVQAFILTVSYLFYRAIISTSFGARL